MTQVGSTDYKGRVIPHVILPTLPKYPPMEFKNEKERERYNRLVYNVKKVLPWAKLTKMTIIETYQILRTLPDQKAREAHLRDVEKGLRKQYAPALKKLTRSQVHTIHHCNFIIQDNIGVIRYSVGYHILTFKQINGLVIYTYIFNCVCDFFLLHLLNLPFLSVTHSNCRFRRPIQTDRVLSYILS